MARTGRSGGGFCLVLFVDTGASLEDAQKWLSAAGLIVVAGYPDYLQVRLRGHPGVNVGVSRGPKAQEQIRTLAVRTPHLGSMSEIGAYFHVTFRDLDEALEHGGTLELAQRVLRDGTRGILYEPWSQGGLVPDG